LCSQLGLLYKIVFNFLMVFLNLLHSFRRLRKGLHY